MRRLQRRSWHLLLITAVVGIASCSSPSTPSPPNGFPDLSKFSAVNPSDYKIAGGAFVSPTQVSCSLSDRYPSILCSGNIPGMPADAPGTGCAVARKPDGESAKTKYSLVREQPDCASSRWTPMSAGHKLTEKNGTCAVGENQLVACIDADNQHGFVLQPSGSWTF